MSLRRLATALAWCVIPMGLQAQLPPLGIPRGMLRVEGSGEFASATKRFLDGESQDLGADWTASSLGPGTLPLLADPSRRVGVLIGSSAYQMNLGTSEGFANRTRSFGALGLGLGLSDRITVFARVPLVYATAKRRAVIGPEGADAGVNAADPTLGTPAGRGAAESFFADFDTGLLTLQDNIVAGTYDADPAQRALAEQTLAGGVALRDSLFALLLGEGTASAYLPTTGSAAGGALSGRVSGLQGTLSGSLGIASFASPLPLPTGPNATYEGVAAIAEDSTGAYQYGAYSVQKGFALGDVEVGAALTFIDGWDRKGTGGFRLAVEGLVRLPTGRKNDADAGFPAPFDGGQLDVQVQGAADVGRGNFGMRLTGGYLLQMASTGTQRVAPPGALLVPVANRTEVSLDPGDELFLGVTPFYRIGRPAALLMGVQYRTRSDDAASYAGTPLPGVDAAVLGEGTGYSTLHLTFGVNYSELPGRAGSRAKTPVDAGWYWDTVIAGSGGRVAKSTTIRVQVRLYGRLW